MTLLLLAAALQLVDQCGSVPDARAVAEVVVTGVIESDALVRRPVPARMDSRVLLHLRRLRLRVENVLLGDAAPGRREVHYFTFLPGPVGSAPLGRWAKMAGCCGRLAMIAHVPLLPGRTWGIRWRRDDLVILPWRSRG
jgi:hypothetical protein